MPRRYKSVSEQNRPDRRLWPKVSVRPAILDVLEIIVRMRHLPDYEIYLIIEDAISRLPEYPKAFNVLSDMPDGLPTPPE